MPKTETNRESQTRRNASLLPGNAPAIAFFLIAVSTVSAFAFLPQIDLVCSRYFYSGGRFIGNTSLGRIARDVARWIPFVLLGAILAANVLSWFAGKLRIAATFAHRFAPHRRSLAFLLLSMALGPGLTVDGLKDLSHRPRPVQVREFGGTNDFRPFYRFDGACPHNCSFPSGEASAAFWTLAPASLAPLPLRPAAVGAALLFGLATGGLRMAAGGHFLSDVLFAGILTIGLVLALRRWALPPARASGTKRSNN